MSNSVKIKIYNDTFNKQAWSACSECNGSQNLTLTSYQTLPDTVSFKATEHIQTKSRKEGLSTGAKWGLGALALAGIGMAVYFATRGKVGAKQTRQLAEHIDFKPAKTVEEAKKFAQEKMGVQYNGIDDVEVINFVNEWLTGVHNSSKLKDFTAYPKFIYPGDFLSKNELFGMLDRVFESNGQKGYMLGVNIKGLKSIPNDLMNVKKNPSGALQLNNAGKLYLKGDKFNTPEINNLVAKLNNYNSSSATLGESLELYHQILGLKSSTIDSDGKVILKKLSKFNSLNHELGHMKHYVNGIHARDMDKLAVYQRLGKPVPELVTEFHKPEIQQIIDRVSKYAKESPAEFVAETYAQLKDGIVFSDDVMTLYKKYGGPAL